MFEKIIVIGSPGAGKSTFARRLNELTALPLYHLDMIWHKPDKSTVSREEFDRKLKSILDSERWRIDGNYQRTLEERVRFCDTVFLLDYPLDVCLSGAKSRIGKKRTDLPWTETEFDDEFKELIMEYPDKKLPTVYRLLEKYSNKNIVIFNSREQADEYLKMLETADSLPMKRSSL